MHWHASVVSSVSSDTNPAIVIHFNEARYVFNTGENTNRAFVQSKATFRKTQAMFFSGLGSDRVGGLPGQSFLID